METPCVISCDRLKTRVRMLQDRKKPTKRDRREIKAWHRARVGDIAKILDTPLSARQGVIYMNFCVFGKSKTMIGTEQKIRKHIGWTCGI